MKTLLTALFVSTTRFVVLVMFTLALMYVTFMFFGLLGGILMLLAVLLLERVAHWWRVLRAVAVFAPSAATILRAFKGAKS